jgi:hypothetical protein
MEIVRVGDGDDQSLLSKAAALAGPANFEHGREKWKVEC